MADLVEDDFRLVSDEYNSILVTYKLPLGISTFKDLSEFLVRDFQAEYEGVDNAIVIEYDEIITKTKLVVRSGIIAKMFDEKSFFRTILGFNLHWNFEHYNEYISRNFTNVSTTDKIHLECDVIDGSVVNGSRQPK